jgi:ATP phosphoribosyltransferase
MLNVHESNLAGRWRTCAHSEDPTIRAFQTDGWLAVNTIVDEAEVRLLSRGSRPPAEDIVEFPLSKVVE